MGSEMCIRDRYDMVVLVVVQVAAGALVVLTLVVVEEPRIAGEPSAGDRQDGCSRGSRGSCVELPRTIGDRGSAELGDCEKRGSLQVLVTEKASALVAEAL